MLVEVAIGQLLMTARAGTMDGCRPFLRWGRVAGACSIRGLSPPLRSGLRHTSFVEICANSRLSLSVVVL